MIGHVFFPLSLRCPGHGDTVVTLWSLVFSEWWACVPKARLERGGVWSSGWLLSCMLVISHHFSPHSALEVPLHHLFVKTLYLKVFSSAGHMAAKSWISPPHLLPVNPVTQLKWGAQQVQGSRIPSTTRTEQQECMGFCLQEGLSMEADCWLLSVSCRRMHSSSALSLNLLWTKGHWKASLLV